MNLTLPFGAQRATRVPRIGMSLSVSALRFIDIAQLSEDGEALTSQSTVGLPALPTPRDDLKVAWYAIKTYSRHEKRVRDHLESRDIETFLPLYEQVRRWKNGCTVRLELPLFLNYLFVCFDVRFRTRVLEIPGVLSLVGGNHKPWPISDSQILTLQKGLHLRKYEPHAYLSNGQRVRIMAGPLVNLTGVLLRRSTDLRVVLTLDQIMQGVAVEVGADEIEPVPESEHSTKQIFNQH